MAGVGDNLSQPFRGRVPRIYLFCFEQCRPSFCKVSANPEGKIRAFNRLDAAVGIELKTSPENVPGLG